MALKEQLKKEVSEEKQKMKDMSPRDKIWYVWEYYKFHIALAIVLVTLFVIVGTSIYNSTFSTRMYCVIINGQDSGESLDSFEKGFRNNQNMGKKDRIYIDTSLIIHTQEDSEYSYASLSKFTALIASKDLDVMITDQENTDRVAMMDGLVNLEDYLPSDLLESYQEDLYYCENSSGTSYPCALSLKNTHFQEASGIQMQEAYYSVFTNSERSDIGIAFLRYILAQ